jgi:AcrR family transcriptional regulator
LVAVENGRTRILDEAARLFLARGYEGTTLRDIADAAGVKAGSIYYHFDSKEDLLAEILDQGIERITRTLDEALADTDPEPATRLRAAIAAHLAALFQHGPYTAAHVGVFGGAPEEVRRAGIPARDAYEERWAKLLDAAVDDPAVDLHVVRVSLLGMMNATLDWYRPDGPRGLDQVAETIADTVLVGLLGRAG